MKIIYDLLINLNKELYNFYEWDEKDKLKYLKKCVLIKTTEYLYKQFMFNSITVDEEFLNLIKNKTEVIKNGKVENIEYFVVIMDGNDVLGVLLNKNGEIEKKTKFLIQDELQIIEASYLLNTKKITYKSLQRAEVKYSFITREEQKKINEILVELEKIKLQTSKIEYLYYEWFDKQSFNGNTYEELKKDIKKEYSSKHEEFLKMLNMLTIK